MLNQIKKWIGMNVLDRRVYDCTGNRNESSVRDYNVHWEVNIYARSPEEAARLALGIQQDKYSIATEFNITNINTGEITIVDIGLLDTEEGEQHGMV